MHLKSETDIVYLFSKFNTGRSPILKTSGSSSKVYKKLSPKLNLKPDSKISLTLSIYERVLNSLSAKFGLDFQPQWT